MHRAWLAVVGILGLLVGGLLGRATAPRPEPQPIPERPEPVVCVERPREIVAVRPAAEATLQLDWCLAQLDAAQAQLGAARHAWPQDREYAANETPEAWAAAIDDVFRDCDLPAERVFTDCSEPPCVAVLRSPALDHEALSGALSGCATFAEAFPDPEIGLTPFAVPCPDGSIDVMYLLATFDEDQRRAYFDDLGMGDLMQSSGFGTEPLSALAEGFRILGRRADALQRFWPCEEGG